jgi:hypothetical protein
MSDELRAKCRCCGHHIVYEEFSEGSSDLCTRCTAGTCWKGSQHDARAAAMDLIRRYVHRGDTEENLRTSSMGSYAWARYDAHIQYTRILITRIHGVPIEARFSLHEIYEACRAELTTGRQLSLFETAS